MVTLLLLTWLQATPAQPAPQPARPRATTTSAPSTTLTITVTAAGGPPIVGAPGTSPGTSSAPPSGALDGALYDDQAFLRTVVDRSEPYVGEQVTVTIYLYIRGSLTSMPTATHEPTTDGFWIQDLLGPTYSSEPTTQIVGSPTPPQKS